MKQISDNRNKYEDVNANKSYQHARKLSKLVVIKGEDANEFINFAFKILEDLGPMTKIEYDLCEKYIFLNWKLRRLYEVERNILNEQSMHIDYHDVLKIDSGEISGKRVRNIKKIDMTDDTVVHLTNLQLELDKRSVKVLDRFRREQEQRNKCKNHSK